MLFSREKSFELFEEIKPMLQKHYEEIAHYQDIPLDPDYEQYQKLEDIGMLRTFTAREPESKRLIGYCVFFVKPNIHYKQSLQASQDILYIDKEFRGKRVGFEFISWCDDQLKTEGVQAIYQHVKAAHNFGPLLEKLGYQLVDLIYARRM